MSEANLKLKQAVIDEIKVKLENASSAVVVDYMGITVEEANSMRRKLRDANVDYKVYKNKLVSRAIAGTEFAALEEVLAGPSAFAFGTDDVTAPARVLNDVMKEYKKMAFKAGIVEGNFYDAEAIKALAEVPSREILLARLLGSFKSPLGSFARLINAIAEAGGGEAAAQAADAAPATEAPAEEAVAAEAPVAPAEEATPAEEAPAADAATPAEEAAPAEEAPAADADAPAEEAPAADADAPTEEAAPAEESHTAEAAPAAPADDAVAEEKAE